jgi:glycosyltransferase involved in cell wall biosynthesis
MPKKEIRVAIIEPVGGHGGMDYYDFGLCGGLSATGIDVVLHTCDETIIPAQLAYEVRHSYQGIYASSPDWIRGLRYLRGTVYAVFSAWREKRLICHFHLFHVGVRQLFNVLLAKSFGRRVVITAHDVESFVENLEVPLLSRFTYRLADRVIAHNQISKQELIDRIGVMPHRIEVIPHGNYLHSLRPLPPQDEARESLEISKSAKVILFFGQIKDVKGLDLLLDALPTVVRTYPELVLLIAGKPWKSDFREYEARISSLGIGANCITHIGYVPDEKVPMYYSAADLVVLPYRRIYQSGVVLMAMSYGKAVLVSDLPGMTEIVTHGNNGLVFRQGNQADLAEKLIAAIADHSSLQVLAKRGFEHVQSRFDWNLIGERTRDLYGSFSKY